MAKKKMKDIPHIPLRPNRRLHTRRHYNDLNQQNPTALTTLLHCWHDLTDYLRAILIRPVMANVTEHVNLCLFRGLWIKKIVWDEVNAALELRWQLRSAFFDSVLVILHDELLEVGVRLRERDA